MINKQVNQVIEKSIWMEIYIIFAFKSIFLYACGLVYFLIVQAFILQKYYFTYGFMKFISKYWSK